MMNLREALLHSKQNPGEICETYVKGYRVVKPFMEEFLRSQNSISKNYPDRFTMLFETKQHYAMRYVYGDHKQWGRAKTKVIIGMKSHVDHCVVVNGGHWNPGYNDIIRFWARKADNIGISGIKDLIEVCLGSYDISLLPSQAWKPTLANLDEFSVLNKKKSLGQYRGSTYHPKLSALMAHLTELEVRDILLRFLITVSPERVQDIPGKFFVMTNSDLAYSLSNLAKKGEAVIINQVILDNLTD